MPGNGPVARGCILTRVGPASEREALTALTGWAGVRAAFLTHGRFDLVADVRGQDVDAIGQLALRASLLPGVLSTETLLGYGPWAEDHACPAGPAGAGHRRALCLILAQAARIQDLLGRLRALPWTSSTYMLLGAADLAAFLDASSAQVSDAIRAVRGMDGVVSVESLVEPA